MVFKIKLAFLFSAILICLLPLSVLAQTGSPLATVNINAPHIVSQDGHALHLSFSLSNREGVQTGVKYGVKLISQTSQLVADQKLYDETLTLYENSTVSKEIAYDAPAQLDGTYALYITSENESGFPFAIASVGTVTLTATAQGIEVQPETCFVQVVGEKSAKHYTLAQGVDIAANETLQLTCTAINRTAQQLSVTPQFETRYFNAYGALAPHNGEKVTSITFKPQEKKTVTIALPVGTTPQFYELTVRLQSDNVPTNAIAVRYLIRGLGAEIRQLSLDKDGYRRGETARVSVVWSVAAGQYLRGTVVTPSKVSLKTTIIGANGEACADPVVSTPDQITAQSTIQVVMQKSCDNPQVVAVLTDGNGTTLDQQQFSFETQKQNRSTGTPAATFIVIGAVIVIGIGMYIRKRKHAAMQTM